MLNVNKCFLTWLALLNIQEGGAVAAGSDRAAEEPWQLLPGVFSTHTATGITGFRAHFPAFYMIFM